MFVWVSFAQRLPLDFLSFNVFLGSTPWKINQEVLDLVIKVFMNQSSHESILNDLSISRNPELLQEPTMDESIKHEGNLLRDY